MKQPSFRRAVPDDAEALARLGRRTFVSTFVQGFGIPYPPEDLATFLDASWSPKAVAAELAEPDGPWWVSEVDGELVAFARCGGCGLPHPDARASHAELKGLYVDAAHQGRGIGRALFETALGWMEARGDGPLWLGVWSGNLKAQRFYGHYGFVKAGEYEYPVGSWRDLEHILRRDRVTV
jgi:diamine N-acetyltransferase